MNYLAHIFLSDGTDESMLGNFLGDFVNKSLESNYNHTVRSGIYMHRKLDTFTDTNPVFLQSKRRISDKNRRFAGVLVDMFYDHFLAKNWSSYCNTPLDQYADRFYKILQSTNYYLPEKLIRRMDVMIEENWLHSYTEINQIKTSLNRIAHRFLKSKHAMVNPIDELIINYESVESDFKMFFPQAIEYADKLKTMNNLTVLKCNSNILN